MFKNTNTDSRAKVSDIYFRKADLKVGDLFMYKVFTIVGEEIGFVICRVLEENGELTSVVEFDMGGTGYITHGAKCKLKDISENYVIPFYNFESKQTSEGGK